MELTATFDKEKQQVQFANGATLPINCNDYWPFEHGEQLQENVHFHITQHNSYSQSTNYQTYQVSRVDPQLLHPAIVYHKQLPQQQKIYNQQLN